MPDLELGLASRAILTQQHFRALLPASPIVATVDLRELMFLEEGAGEEAIGGEMPVFAAGYDFHRHRRAAGRVPFGLHLRPQFLDALFFVARHDLAGMPVLDAARRLDFGNQIRVLQQVRALRARSLGIVLSTHHPEHAFACASSVALLHRGALQAVGPPEQVLTAAALEEVYDVPVNVQRLTDGQLSVTPAFRPAGNAEDGTGDELGRSLP